MKFFIFTLVSLTMAFAENIYIDWKNVKPIEYSPAYRNTLPPYLRNSGSMKGARFGYQHRIVGGVESVKHSRPYQAAILTTTAPNGDQYFCGAIVYNSFTVITAAHCCVGVTSAVVILGAHNVTDASEIGQVQIAVNGSNNFIVHPNYDPSTSDRDICLIKLPEAVDLSGPYIKGCPLPPTTIQDCTSIVGQIATVSGWGISYSVAFGLVNGPQQQTLHEVSNNVISLSQCQPYYFSTNLTNSIYCLSNAGMKSSCNGDSGGPVTLKAVSSTNVIDVCWGLVSFGSSLGCTFAPSGNTCLPFSRSFIDQYSQASWT